MVCFHSSISVDQHMDMAKSVNSTDQCLKLRQINQIQRNRKAPNSLNHLSIPACRQSRTAVVDVVILIAVVGAFGFLLFPYVMLLSYKIVEIVGTIMYVVKEEVLRAPMIYGCLGLSILCAVIAVMAITVCTIRKCGRPGCRGLRKAAEFDIQLETQECVKNSSNLGKYGVKRGLFELPRDHHRELEAELKKMAPPNGRAVLVFRARCGCSVGRMEVPGPKKTRKVKK
uniref:Ribosomal protein L34e superfamily protein n=1 Tax=Davidia involucrata TaxID=16924 RepID=A0A5B7B0W4_DAVIN